MVIFGGFRAIGILGLSLSMPIVQEGPYRNVVYRGEREF
jgi:hypothetical protein